MPDRPDRPEPSAGGPEPEPWVRVDSVPGDDLTVFRTRFDRVRHPRTGNVHKRIVLEAPDWANVVALTPDRLVVLVRQYRFGTRCVTTEIPGGAVDPGETPEQTARRELREETGYTAPRWTYLGSVAPNPAILDNRHHQFVAEGAERTHPQSLDPGEDIVVLTASQAELRAMVHRGEIDHSLILCALYRVFDLR